MYAIRSYYDHVDRRVLPGPQLEGDRPLVNEHPEPVERDRAASLGGIEKTRLRRVGNDVADDHAGTDRGVVEQRHVSDVGVEADRCGVDQHVGLRWNREVVCPSLVTRLDRSVLAKQCDEFLPAFLAAIDDNDLGSTSERELDGDRLV